MVDNEKLENLANARRKLKKFRDQQQLNNSLTNGTDGHSINGSFNQSPVNHKIISQPFNNVGHLQNAQRNGNYYNLSKSPVSEYEEKNLHFVSLLDNQKQQRILLEEQRRLSGENNHSGRSSQASVEIEQKTRRDVEQLQGQLEVHVQTIGVLVAEKTDLSAKLNQSFKQLERKQGEMDELYGRLKASRERVQELEKQLQNSTSSVQKREMAAKESDKENDRLKIENIRQSQSIEDLKQTINHLNEKVHNQQNIIQQYEGNLNKNQSPIFEEQIDELKKQNLLQKSQIDELTSSINRVRFDNEQYQQYNSNMQQHIQELNDQINQLTKTNNILQNEYDIMRKSSQIQLNDQSFIENANVQQENQLLRNAIDQWSSRYEELRLKLEDTTKLLKDKDDTILDLKFTVDNSTEKIRLIEMETEVQKLSNENLNLKNFIETTGNNNQQFKSNNDQQIQTDFELSVDSNHENESHQKLFERFNRAMQENADLKDRIQNLEHVILQLQSETETIGDYIHLYQQQREQLQRRYQEKDDYIKQLTKDRTELQKTLSELEILLSRDLNKLIPNADNSIHENQTNPSEQSQLNNTENQQSIDTAQTPLLNNDLKDRISSLIRQLSENKLSSSSNDVQHSRIKLAFVDDNLYVCSTCSGPVQWV